MTPISSEAKATNRAAELQLLASEQQAQLSTRRHSYELTQRLTFFVISAQLIACGYMLLYADKFGAGPFLRWLFLATGTAAFFGLLWRFFYNQTYHMRTFGSAWNERNETTKGYRRIAVLQIISYDVFLILSIVFMIGAIALGFSYLTHAQASTPQAYNLLF